MTVMLDAACIDAQITALHDDILAKQHLLEETASLRRRSYEAAEAAEAMEDRWRREIRDDVAEEQRLLDELDRLVPGQRPSA